MNKQPQELSNKRVVVKVNGIKVEDTNTKIKTYKAYKTLNSTSIKTIVDNGVKYSSKK